MGQSLAHPVNCLTLTTIPLSLQRAMYTVVEQRPSQVPRLATHTLTLRARCSLLDSLREINPDNSFLLFTLCSIVSLQLLGCLPDFFSPLPLVG